MLEEHHLRMLTLTAYAWDRANTASRTIQASGGTTFIDRFGQPLAQPEIITEGSTISFARLNHKLDLDARSSSNTAQPPEAISNQR